MKLHPAGNSPALLACVLLLAFGLCSCAKQPAGHDPGVDARLHATLGNFGVFSPESATDDPMTPVYVTHNRRNISQTDDPMREVTASPARDFPLPGCESLNVEMFTGGANCCFGYYLLAACPDGDHAAYIEPADAGLGETRPAMRAYAVTDPAFMYYASGTQTEPGPFSFNRPESPRLNRFLVFDNGGWRADRPGEFAAAYQAMRSDAANAKDMNTAAKAITVAYYSLMAGDRPKTVYRTFERTLRLDLPLRKREAHVPAEVFVDIEKAVKNFSPVRNVTVQ